MPHSVGSPLLWAGFALLILGMLALDLGLLRRDAREVTPREALRWVLLWISLAVCFGIGITLRNGSKSGLEFFTGYLIEYALSVDNIFVFLVIFSYFSVPAAYQRGVLVWGVLGAIVLRAVFILLGAALLNAFHWIIYLFGAFLILTGFKILTQGDEEVHPEHNPVVRLFRRCVPSVPEYHDSRFTVLINGRRYATPLLLVLITVEATDLVFAVDSIPAIFAITRDPFIVLSSNIFAILGLRSLYFLLADFMDKFRYLKVGLGLVLAFVGLKMVVSGYYTIPIVVSLVIVVALLGGAVAASLLNPPATPPLPVHRHVDDDDSLEPSYPSPEPAEEQKKAG